MGWPTTDDPRTQFVTLRMTESEEQALLAHVSAEGHKDRSSAVRDAVIRVINADEKRRNKEKHAGRADA